MSLQYMNMKAHTSRPKKKTEPLTDRDIKDCKQNPHAENGRRCKCCQGRNKYPNYLEQLREQRLQKRRKKNLAESLLQFPLKLNNIEEKLATEKVQMRKSILNSLSHDISEFQETPHKPSMLQSLHEAIIKSSLKSSQNKFKESVKQIEKSVRRQSIVQHPTQNYLFQISIEIGDKKFIRDFSAPEYGAAALKQIEHILGRPFYQAI